MICPWPTYLRVTNGVPSLSCAMTRSARAGSGCAITCAETVTSGGICKPKNGLSSPKAASDLGSPQLIAPPTLRPPARRRTGINGSSLSRLTSLAARRGPAKRRRMPPSSSQSSKASCSAMPSVATSASAMTSGFAGMTSVNAPDSKSAVGSSAFSR